MPPVYSKESPSALSFFTPRTRCSNVIQHNYNNIVQNEVIPHNPPQNPLATNSANSVNLTNNPMNNPTNNPANITSPANNPANDPANNPVNDPANNPANVTSSANTISPANTTNSPLLSTEDYIDSDDEMIDVEISTPTFANVVISEAKQIK